MDYEIIEENITISSMESKQNNVEERNNAEYIHFLFLCNKLAQREA